MSLLQLTQLISSIGLAVVGVTIPSLSPLLWVAFCPFLLAIRQMKPLKSFAAGFSVGAIFFSIFLGWITRYELRIFLLVLSAAAFFFACFGALTCFFWQKTSKPLAIILTPPLAWCALSFIYSQTTLDTLGDQLAIFAAPSLPALVYTTGISGVTFLIWYVNSLAAYCFWIKKNRLWLLVITVLLAASFRTQPKIALGMEPIQVALIQHNFPISSEWRSLHQEEILIEYENAALAYGPDADLIVFPQYGLPFDALRTPDSLLILPQRTNSPILLGTYVPKTAGASVDQGERTNSALLFGTNQSIQEYQAVAPPPFRRIGQVLGQTHRPLMLGTVPIGVLLCYEDVKSSEGLAWVRAGAEILFALSNTGHFTGTPLARYHLLHDRIRAIETGRFVVRVSPNGYTAVIDPHGNLIQQSNLNEKAIITGEISPSRSRTLFSRWGPLVPFGSFVWVVIWFFRDYPRDWIKRLARKTR